MPAKGGRFPKSSSNSSSTLPKKTPEEYLEKIDEFREQLDFHSAVNVCRIALSPEKGYPNNVKILQTMGEVYMDLGEVENAKQSFSKAVKAEPNTGYEKFFNLGQLNQGNASVTYFMRGIEILKKNPNDSGISTQDAARAISDAFCSIAEVYMTDLCDIPAAETECSNAVENAKKADPQNAHAFITSASCKISQQLTDLAKADAKAAFSLLTKSGDNANDSDDDIGLSFSRKLNAARILIELELIEESEDLLHFIKKQMKDSADICYLLGVCSKTQEFYEEAAKYFQKALDIFDATEGQRDNKEERDLEFRGEISKDLKETEKLLKSGKGKQRPVEKDDEKQDMADDDVLDDKDYENDIPDDDDENMKDKEEEDVDMEK